MANAEGGELACRATRGESGREACRWRPNCAARKASFCTFNKNTPENVIVYLRKSKCIENSSLCVIKMVTVY